MNILPTIKLIFDRRKSSTPTKKGEVCIEVYYRRKRRWYSTHVNVYSHQWNNGMVVNHTDSFILNQNISEYKDKILSICKEIALKGEFSFQELDYIIHPDSADKDEKNSFKNFLETRIEERNDIKESTKKSHRKIINVLNEFNAIDSFESLTKHNILKFDTWLRNRNITQTTVYTYHKILKTYIREAMILDFIQCDPYFGIRLDKGKAKKRRYLTDVEIKKIKDADLPAALEKIRDLFLFQCYTGFSYSDMMECDYSRIIERNGKYILQDRRVKTNEDYYIVLLSPAMQILKKYDFKLPKITNQQYNLRLGLVATAANLSINVTSHMGRHSFAVMALNKGVSIEVLAKMMGHSEIETTQLYAKLLNPTLEKEYELLDSKL